MKRVANADDVSVTEIVRPTALLLYFVLRRPGGFSEEPEPDPISNSAVKLLSADGT